MEKYIELFMFMLAIICVNLWWEYITEPTRILGFVGKFRDRWYRKKTDDYPWYMMWYGCVTCRTFWSAIGFSVWMYFEGANLWHVGLFPIFTFVLFGIVQKMTVK